MQAALSATFLTKQTLNAQTQPSPGFPANKTISNLIFPTESEFSQPLNKKNIQTHATNQGDLTKAYSASSPFSQYLPPSPNISPINHSSKVVPVGVISQNNLQIKSRCASQVRYSHPLQPCSLTPSPNQAETSSPV